MLLYIVRHGETDWNREKRLQGQTDILLNENGISIAETSGKAMQDIPFDLCFSSPLMRVRQTAEGILKYNTGYRERFAETAATYLKARPAAEISMQGEVPLVIESRITEISLGEWEGISLAEEENKPLIAAFFADPDKLSMPKGAECAGDVKRRTAAFLQELVRQDALQEKNILIATHGFAMRALLNPLYEDPSDFWQGRTPYNCETAILEAKEGRISFLDRGRVYYPHPVLQ